MSAFRSDPDVEVREVTGTGAEVDVALNLINGNIRLSILWAQETQLSADDAERVARALQRAAAESRSRTKAEPPGLPGAQAGSPAV
ncbi:hypothetical protein [Streptomyces sp. PsTaAH-124]|uniref:hypothetical protein n=1 Tax=Streptomyces sp. PsTaAH-124 TaxID=1157638 RepID=UPI00036926DD|nr:hypothetical protein [Streptomyces sp. PsTaAH-124]